MIYREGVGWGGEKVYGEEEKLFLFLVFLSFFVLVLYLFLYIFFVFFVCYHSTIVDIVPSQR